MGFLFMTGITLSQAETQLAYWLAADTAVANGQDVTYGDKRLTRANANAIRENIIFWDNQVKRLSRSGGVRISGGTPC